MPALTRPWLKVTRRSEQGSGARGAGEVRSRLWGQFPHRQRGAAAWASPSTCSGLSQGCGGAPNAHFPGHTEPGGPESGRRVGRASQGFHTENFSTQPSNYSWKITLEALTALTPPPARSPALPPSFIPALWPQSPGLSTSIAQQSPVCPGNPTSPPSTGLVTPPKGPDLSPFPSPYCLPSAPTLPSGLSAAALREGRGPAGHPEERT